MVMEPNPGRKARRASWLLVAAMTLCLTAIPALAGAATGAATQVSQRKARLEQLSQAYRKAWFQLSQNRQKLEELRQETARALKSNAAVVMFRSLADLIPKMMEAPSGLGLVQDLLQQALFDTEAKPKQQRQIDGLALQNLESRQELGARYQEMVRALKAPLERFDDDQPPFPHAKQVWRQPDGKPDDKLERITRRLRVINWLAYELIQLHDREIEQLVQARMQVEAQIRSLQAEAPEQPTQAGAPGVAPAMGELLRNANFSQGLQGWTIAGHGYGSRKQAQKVLGPTAQSAGVRMGACGGTRSIYQKVAVSGLNLVFRGRVRVEKWSTFDQGTPGGWVALGFSFQDASGHTLHSVHYYLNPYNPHTAKPRVTWHQLKPALPVPTGWMKVKANLADIAAKLHLKPGRVSQVVVFATTFGTHEDEVLTVADFAGLSLVGTGRPSMAAAAAAPASQPPNPAAASPAMPGWVDKVTGALAKVKGSNRFLVLTFGTKIVQFASDPKRPELVMDVPAQRMTPAERRRFEQSYPGFHRVDYQGGYSYQVNFHSARAAAAAARHVAAEIWRSPPGFQPDIQTGRF